MRKKIKYVLDDVYNACKEEQQSNNPMVLIWLKPTYDFISRKLKCGKSKAFVITRELEETYDLYLKRADGYIVEKKHPTSREVWGEWMKISLEDKKLQELVTRCLYRLKKRYSGQELKENMIKWAKRSKYKDQIQLIDSDNVFDDKPIPLLEDLKQRPNASLTVFNSELDDLCS